MNFGACPGQLCIWAFIHDVFPSSIDLPPGVLLFASGKLISPATPDFSSIADIAFFLKFAASAHFCICFFSPDPSCSGLVPLLTFCSFHLRCSCWWGYLWDCPLWKRDWQIVAGCWIGCSWACCSTEWGKWYIFVGKLLHLLGLLALLGLLVELSLLCFLLVALD